MEWLWKVDWAGIYEPKRALLDVFLRGSALYLLIFVLLRLVVRRQIGGIGITDILVIVLIAEVTGNGISDNFSVDWRERYPGLYYPVLEHADRVRLATRGATEPRSSLTKHGALANGILTAACTAELPLFLVNRLAGLTAFVLAKKP